MQIKPDHIIFGRKKSTRSKTRTTIIDLIAPGGVNGKVSHKPTNPSNEIKRKIKTELNSREVSQEASPKQPILKLDFSSESKDVLPFKDFKYVPRFDQKAMLVEQK